jgi:hypothetical protein
MASFEGDGMGRISSGQRSYQLVKCMSLTGGVTRYCVVVVPGFGASLILIGQLTSSWLPDDVVDQTKLESTG